jgi:transcriptional regulator with XRE-family HTH domain
MGHPVTHRPTVVTVTVFPVLSGTASNQPISDRDLLVVLGRTNSGLPSSFQSANSAEANREALHELRKLSGLTWEQLAKLFNVSRRSLHFWASGQPLSRFNEENLNRLLGTIRYINRGSASINRHLLLSPGRDGRLLFDLLIAGEHEEVKRTLGSGNAPPKPQLVPLSEDARMSRMPPPPEELVDALQEPIHREVGRSRPARAARSRQHGS